VACAPLLAVLLHGCQRAQRASDASKDQRLLPVHSGHAAQQEACAPAEPEAPPTQDDVLARPLLPVQLPDKPVLAGTPPRKRAPLLPTGALHRQASKAARAAADASDGTARFHDRPRDVLWTPELRKAARSSSSQAAVVASPPVGFDTVGAGEARKTSKIRFCDCAEWILFDDDQLTAVTVSKMLPLSFH